MMNMIRLLELVEKAITIDPPPAIQEYCDPWYSPYYHLLCLLAMERKGSLCVELGVEGGRGSKAMLEGLGTVIGIDNNHKPELDRIIGDEAFLFIHGSSLPPPEPVTKAGKSIVLLHVDTEHTYNQAREEFSAYRPYLQDGAVVLFDDTNACEGEVKRFVESLPYSKFFDDRLHTSCGFGGIIYREDP